MGVRPSLRPDAAVGFRQGVRMLARMWVALAGVGVLALVLTGPALAVVPLDHKPTAPAARPLPASCDPAAAEALLRSGITLIDVRSPEEFGEAKPVTQP